MGLGHRRREWGQERGQAPSACCHNPGTAVLPFSLAPTPAWLPAATHLGTGGLWTGQAGHVAEPGKQASPLEEAKRKQMLWRAIGKHCLY